MGAVSCAAAAPGGTPGQEDPQAALGEPPSRRSTLRSREACQPTESDAPSFAYYVDAERRINAHLGERNFPGRANQIARKLKSYSFAQSHGIRIPGLFGLWNAPGDIPWDDLPDQIVLKSNTGAAGRGVFPLRRIDGRWLIVTRDEPMEPAEIVAQLSDLIRNGRIRRAHLWPRAHRIGPRQRPAGGDPNILLLRRGRHGDRPSEDYAREQRRHAESPIPRGRFSRTPSSPPFPRRRDRSARKPRDRGRDRPTPVGSGPSPVRAHRLLRRRRRGVRRAHAPSRWV